MASEEEEGCFTLIWEIENFCLLLSAEEGMLWSPAWKVEDTEGSAWRQLLAHHSGSRIIFTIIRFERHLHSDLCEMSLIFSCGAEVPLKSDSDLYSYFERDEIHGEKRQSILPNDTLTLCCRKRVKTIKIGESRIYSVLCSVDYLWNIEMFDSSSSYSTFIEKDNLLLFVTLEVERGNIIHTFKVFEEPRVENCLFFVDCKLSIEDRHGRVINKTSDTYTIWKYDIEIYPENNASINLQLQSIVAHHKSCQDQLARNFSSKIDKRLNVSEAVFGSLSDDLLLMYRERTLSDATLNTEGKSFSAHRSILAARSPVFRAMFEKDEMKEGCSGVVDIEDVDSETVDRMLVFMYGDSLEDLHWKEASALYYAADKYAVHHLKRKCTDILQAGLAVDNACDVLVLADAHSDEQLKEYTVDFIRDHQEVFSSSDWEKLEKSNPYLTVKIFREIYVKRGKI